METSTIKNIFSAVCILGGIFLVYANRRRLLNLFVLPDENEAKDKQDKGDDRAMADVCKSFIMYADIFQGLYEPMYKSSVGKIQQERMNNVLAEWDIRMNSIRNIPVGLRGWWATIIANKDTLSYNELLARSQNVIRMIEKCGIIRDKQSELIAKSDTNQYYQHVDDIMFEVGLQLRIESPCWYLPGNPVRIIERGYCEIL